jgi:hypothetical protein
MILKMRSMTFVLLLIMLFSGVVHGRSEVIVNDEGGLKIDSWFINLFYPPVYHPVPGSTTWFDSKTGLPDRTSNALSNPNLAHKGLGTPMISLPAWYILYNEYKNRPDLSKTEKKMDVRYEDKLVYDYNPANPVVPVCPEIFPTGEKNIYGYDWIYLDPSRTGLTYTQEYYDAVNAYVAPFRDSAIAGVGPLY